MRLIDVEKLKIQEIYDEDLKAHFVVEEDDLAERPEVKAIPIEWIKKWYRRALDNSGFMGDETISVGDLLEDWEKENE